MWLRGALERVDEAHTGGGQVVAAHDAVVAAGVEPRGACTRAVHDCDKLPLGYLLATVVAPMTGWMQR
jgi:hypothetical protein